MRTPISFTEFAARLKIGDSLFIRGSTYPKSEFFGLLGPGAERQYPRRDARVVRVGKNRIDLLSNGDIKRQITNERIELVTHQPDAPPDTYKRYRITSKLGAIIVSHYPLQIPQVVVDDEVYRWSVAHWGAPVWVIDTDNPESSPLLMPADFNGTTLVYGRTCAEAEWKLRSEMRKRSLTELEKALPGFGETPTPPIQYVAIRAVLDSLNKRDHKFRAWGPFDTGKQAIDFAHKNFRKNDKLILPIQPPSSFKI